MCTCTMIDVRVSDYTFMVNISRLILLVYSGHVQHVATSSEEFKFKVLFFA